MTVRVEPPVCVFCWRRPVDPGRRPFCSDRCRLGDLARWADGTYSVQDETVPDRELEPEEEERKH